MFPIDEEEREMSLLTKQNEWPQDRRCMNLKLKHHSSFMDSFGSFLKVGFFVRGDEKIARTNLLNFQ